jgi:nucleoid DNA-binding protein
MANKTQKSIIKIDDTLLAELYDCLLQYNGVKITGFGMFTVIKTKGIKQGVNPFTRKRQNFPPYFKIKFRPVKALKDEIKKCKI